MRNLIRLAAGGFEIELHQNPDLPANLGDLRGQWVRTTDLFVRNVTQDQVETVRAVVDRVCDLLSFATESRVLPYFWEYPAGSGVSCQYSMTGTVQLWRYPFAEPEHAKHFVDSCYNRFTQLRDARKLHVVIDYMYHSVMGSIAAEIKIALACVTFENLRHNWALDSGYPYIDGWFREKGATAAAPGKSVGIRRHWEEMFVEVGMNVDVQRIFDTRNEVIHTGLYGNVHNDDTFDYLHTTLREYFLRLMGYHGPFIPYVGGSPAPTVI